METRTFNAQDWSGETMKIKVYKRKGDTQAFTVNGDRYELRFAKPALSNEDGSEDKYDFFQADVHSDAHNGEKMFAVSRFRCDTEWEGTFMGIGRTDADPVNAAALVIRMTV
jgi:hypothetical protein